MEWGEHQGEPPAVKVVCKALPPGPLHQGWSLLLRANDSRLPPVLDVAVTPQHMLLPLHNLFQNLEKPRPLQGVARFHTLWDIRSIHTVCTPKHTHACMPQSAPQLVQMQVHTRDTHRWLICPPMKSTFIRTENQIGLYNHDRKLLTGLRH